MEMEDCDSRSSCSGTPPIISTPSDPNADGDGFSVEYGATQPSPPTTVSTPALTSVSPSSGSALGGQSVTIAGSGFEPGATVDFDSSPATAVYFSSSDQLSAVTPRAWPEGSR